jgi:hypothetical protein
MLVLGNRWPRWFIITGLIAITYVLLLGLLMAINDFGAALLMAGLTLPGLFLMSFFSDTGRNMTMPVFLLANILNLLIVFGIGYLISKISRTSIPKASASQL